MEIEEKHNPKYHERLRPKSWSDLPQDLLISVFERLSFANFQRAKSVCSSWYSASRQSVPNNQIPWLILFPENNDNDNYKNSSCTLFNPEEKHKLYKTKDLGVEFAKSVCLATCGSWLLMRDRQIYPMYIFYIVNLFTHERINLPPVDLLWKDYELHNASQKREILRGTRVRSPVFWIEEKTKDYVVIWGFNHWCVVYSKKGDTLWNQIPQTSACFDMVYKDHKLYFLSYAFYGHFKIFDFSGEIPLQTFRGYVRVEEIRFDRGVYRQPCAQQLVVTLTGIVLKVDRWIRKDKTWYFQIFKVYPSESIEKPEQIQKKPEQIHSLGDESILLDQGITILANDTDGFIRNSIYFTVGYGQNKYDMLIFNLETQETMEPPLHTLIDSSSFQFSKAQWFLPSFTHT